MLSPPSASCEVADRLFDEYKSWQDLIRLDTNRRPPLELLFLRFLLIKGRSGLSMPLLSCFMPFFLRCRESLLDTRLFATLNHLRLGPIFVRYLAFSEDWTSMLFCGLDSTVLLYRQEHGNAKSRDVSSDFIYFCLSRLGPSSQSIRMGDGLPLFFPLLVCIFNGDTGVFSTA